MLSWCCADWGNLQGLKTDFFFFWANAKYLLSLSTKKKQKKTTPWGHTGNCAAFIPSLNMQVNWQASLLKTSRVIFPFFPLLSAHLFFHLPLAMLIYAPTVIIRNESEADEKARHTNKADQSQLECRFHFPQTATTQRISSGKWLKRLWNALLQWQSLNERELHMTTD